MSAITGIWLFFAMIDKRVRVFLTRAGDTNDVATGRGQFRDLLQRCIDVVRLRGAHGLHRDGEIAAHTYRADLQLPCLASRSKNRCGCRGHSQSDRDGHVCAFLS